MQVFNPSYERVEVCPLCGGSALGRARLQRFFYYFGRFRIPLPDGGVRLLECQNCSLLFKDVVPCREDLKQVLSAAAQEVWKPKRGVHPAAAWIEPHIRGKPTDILDIGASNGDLLEQLQSSAGRLSALDVAVFSRCQAVVTGEYIVGEIEGNIEWSGHGYDVVTAFDIFEHFLEPRQALNNIAHFVKAGGRLIIETGDWQSYSSDLGRWYYSNLFEHQIFWSKPALAYVCQSFGFEFIRYTRVNHKGRRALSYPKRAALAALTTMTRVPGLPSLILAVTGRDPLLFGAPFLQDHAFCVLEKAAAA